MLTACSRIAPASFWKDFHSASISSQHNDHGPWGGYREMSWKADSAHPFASQELIRFAAEGDWKLIDSMQWSKGQIADGKTYKGDDYSLELFKKNIVPIIQEGGRVYIFSTDWLSVEAGNTRETYTNGFALLNAKGTELKIIHIWGE